MYATGRINEQLRYQIQNKIDKALPEYERLCFKISENHKVAQKLYDQVIMPELQELGAGSFEKTDKILRKYVPKNTQFHLTIIVEKNDPDYEFFRYACDDITVLTGEEGNLFALSFEFELKNENYLPTLTNSGYIYADSITGLERETIIVDTELMRSYIATKEYKALHKQNQEVELIKDTVRKLIWSHKVKSIKQLLSVWPALESYLPNDHLSKTFKQKTTKKPENLGNELLDNIDKANKLLFIYKLKSGA